MSQLGSISNVNPQPQVNALNTDNTIKGNDNAILAEITESYEKETI